MDTGPDAVAFTAYGVHLREWRADDAEVMSHLFDTEQMNRWTPLPSPFDPEVAAAYIAAAHQARQRDGTLQLAICAASAGPALGEVLAFPAEQADTLELAYAVGAEHQGLRLAARAVCALLELARLGRRSRALLTISVDNGPSRGTALAAGFARTTTPLRTRERKGFVLQMETWERSL